jgi:hypothetical protein
MNNMNRTNNDHHIENNGNRSHNRNDNFDYKIPEASHNNQQQQGTNAIFGGKPLYDDKSDITHLNSTQGTVSSLTISPFKKDQHDDVEEINHYHMDEDEEVRFYLSFL